MKTKRLRAFALFASLAITQLVTSCTKRETAVEAGIRTQTLLVGNGAEPADLDPHLADTGTQMNLLVALFEGLTFLDEKTGLAVPAAAERWESSADGLTWTFHLRPGLKWSNGDPLTARDFVYSIRRFLTPELGSEWTNCIWAVKNAQAFHAKKVTDFALVGVAAPDDTTLQFTLERPTPYFPALVSQGYLFPVHRATIEKFGRMEDRGTRWTRAGNLVGNGPFTLTEWTPNARILVTRNPHYWNTGRTGPQQIVFFPIENPDAEERAFRAGQLHVTFTLPLSKLSDYRAHAAAQLRIEPQMTTTFLSFNVTKAPFTDRRVRRAFALGIDREVISRQLFNGLWPAARSQVPSGLGGYVPRTMVADDWSAARRLLAEAGFPGGKGFPPVAVHTQFEGHWVKMAEVLQGMWHRELGIDVTIEPTDEKTWVASLQKHTHSIALLYWMADFSDPVSFLDTFTSASENNFSAWASPAYDALLARASRTLDPQARFEVFREAERLLLDEAPVAPILQNTSVYAVHPAVKNWVPSMLTWHRYQRIELHN